MKTVALHPEGVDRNKLNAFLQVLDLLSPSTRRAWIEIASGDANNGAPTVALHPEGVDRNYNAYCEKHYEK